jgi:hypothetical protein
VNVYKQDIQKVKKKVSVKIYSKKEIIFVTIIIVQDQESLTRKEKIVPLFKVYSIRGHVSVYREPRV